MMKLRDARLCAQCEEIYEGLSECPACASKAFILICKFVPTSADFERWTAQLDEVLSGDSPHEGVQATHPFTPPGRGIRQPYTERRSTPQGGVNAA